MAEDGSGFWWPARITTPAEREWCIQQYPDYRRRWRNDVRIIVLKGLSFWLCPSSSSSNITISPQPKPEGACVVILCWDGQDGNHHYYVAEDCLRITREELVELYQMSQVNYPPQHLLVLVTKGSIAHPIYHNLLWKRRQDGSLRKRGPSARSC